MIYTINRTKRRAGIRNQPGESIRELLRIVHAKKQGIAESEIRDIVKKPPLIISVNKTVNNHLDNLEKKYLVRHDFEKGIGNTWYSEVYQKINNDLKDCGIPALTETEEALTDFLIEHSKAFRLFLTTENLCKLIKNAMLLHKLEKINHNFQKSVNLLRSKYGIPPPDKETPNFWAIGNLCINIDIVKGDININDPNFQKTLSKFVGLRESSQSVEEIVVAINQVMEASTEKLKEIEF